jgi:hypothetical protein
MSDTIIQRSDADLMQELAAGMTGMASEIDFAICCNDTSDNGILVVQRSVAHIMATCAQLDATGYGGELCQFRDAAQRGEAFLAQHGHSSQ